MISQSTVISEAPEFQPARRPISMEPASEKSPVKAMKVMPLSQVDQTIREKSTNSRFFSKSGGYPTHDAQQSIYMHLMSSSKRLIENGEKKDK
jgi:hypothetical protein